MWLFRKRKRKIQEKDSIVSELWDCQFSNPEKNRFELEDTESMTAMIRDDSLCLAAKKQNIFIWSLNNLYRYKDFILDALISIDSNNGHSAAGILFRYANDSNYYYMMVSENGYFRLDVVFNGTPRILIPWTSCEFVSLDKIRIKIIFHGVSINIFLDDVWVGEVEDDSIDAGYIAFGGQNFSDRDNAYFFLREILIESRSVEVELAYQNQVKDGSIPVGNRWKLAQRLFEAGQYTAVLIQIKKALKNNPINFDLSFLMAKSLSRLGLYDEALKAFKACFKQPEHVNKELIIEKASLLYRMNNLAGLKVFLDSILDIQSKDSFLLNLRGNTEDGLGMFEKAIDFYKQALELEPNNAFYKLNIARTLEKMEDGESAFSYYYEAALSFFRDENYDELSQVLIDMNRTHPGNSEGRILEGKILFSEQRLNEAFEIFHNLREEGLKDTSVDFLYGIILKERGRIEEALALFKSSAMDEVDYYPYWFKYAETLNLMGLPAEEAALTAIKLENDNPWAHNLYGVILLSENRAEEAKRSFERALELEEHSIDILMNYSDAVAAVDGTQAALSLFTGESDNPAVANQRGNLFYANGEYEKAVESYRKAVSADDNNRAYKENLASALIKEDYVLSAEEILSGLMEEYPTSETLEMIARVAFRKGEYNRAEASFLEAIKLDPDNYKILLNYSDFLFTRLNYQKAGEIAEKILALSDKKRIRSADLEIAKAMIERVKRALNDRYECSSCGREWWVPKNIPNINVVRLHGEPAGESPAGKCRVCGKVYCVECAKDYIKDSHFVCPDCDEHLKLSENYLKYLASYYAER